MEQQIKFFLELMIPKNKAEIDKEIEKLNIRGLAERNGKNNLPGPDDKIEDQVESFIKTNSREKFAKLAKIYRNGINDKKKRIENIISEIESKKEKAKKDYTDWKVKAFDRQLRTKEKLKILAKEEKEKYEDLDKFKSDHKVSRTAKEKAPLTFLISYIFFIIMIESAMNSFFFAETNSFGLVGGLLTAFVFSLINVLIPFFICKYLIRLIYLNKMVFKICGALFVTFEVFYIFTVNFIFAHLREIDLEDPDVKKLMIEKIFADPTYSTLSSWLLFLLGISIAVSAVIKALTYEDLIPGYSDFQAEYNNAKKKIYNEKNDYLGIVDKEYKATKSTIDNLARRIEILGNEMRDLETTQSEFMDEYIYCIQLINEEYKAIILYYRNENRIHRTLEAPDYFQKNPDELEENPSKNALKNQFLMGINPINPDININSYRQFCDELYPQLKEI